MLNSVRTLARLFIITSSFTLTNLAIAEQETSEIEQSTAALSEQEQWFAEVNAKLKPQHGDIALPNGVATLHVSDAFYYLDPQGAEVVLNEIWGNPPSDNLTLGMLMPSGSSPFETNSWAVTIEYVEEGYVDDSDAADIDYDELLESMQADVKESSEWRVEQGYEAIELVGWAQSPYYDAETKKLYWAKEIHFGDMETNTLNYNIRVLGRKGYLVLNFIASMDQMAEIDNNLNEVLAMAEFNEGSRYSDFDPDIDKVAAYGLGALVAGKVLAKTGLIAGLILILKKFGVVILVAIGALFKTVFGRKKS